MLHALFPLDRGPGLPELAQARAGLLLNRLDLIFMVEFVDLLVRLLYFTPDRLLVEVRQERYRIGFEAPYKPLPSCFFEPEFLIAQVQREELAGGKLSRERRGYGAGDSPPGFGPFFSFFSGLEIARATKRMTSPT